MPVTPRRRATRKDWDIDCLSFLATGITPNDDHEWGRFWNTPPEAIPADVLGEMRECWERHREDILRQYAGFPDSRPLWAEKVFDNEREEK